MRKIDNNHHRPKDCLVRHHFMFAYCAAFLVLIVSATVTYEQLFLRRSTSSDPFQRVLRSKKTKTKTMINNVHVPTDMWRLPSEFPSWKPVPLRTCCTSLRASVATGSNAAKFYTSCDMDGEAQRYYGPGMGYTPDDLITALDGRDLIILGDSLSCQWFEQLSCYLGGWHSWHGFALKPIKDNYAKFEEDLTESFYRFRPHYRHKKQEVFGKIGHATYSTFGTFDIPSKVKGGMRVIHQGLNNRREGDVVDALTYYNTIYPSEYNRKRPVLVINIGLHYNVGQNGHQFIDLQHFYDTILRTCRQNDALCILRETSPQFFETDEGDGLWQFGKSNDVCLSEPPSSFNTLNRWRNDLLHGMVGDEGDTPGGGFVRVMPIFDKISGVQTKYYNGKQDCTHFKMDPEVWEPWHLSLTEVLMDPFSAVSR